MKTHSVYLLRQPDRLESLAIDQLAAWIGSLAEEIMTPISEMSRHDADAELSRTIAAVRHCLQHCVPWMLHDSLAAKTIPELYRLLENTDTKITGRMVETLFTSDLTTLSLDFKQFMMFRGSLRSNSHLLTGLVRLHFNFDKLDFVRSFTDDIESDIIKILEKLHNLKYLTVTARTNQILKCVVKNNPSIEELILHQLNDVDDDDLNMLSQSNLRKINLMASVRCTTIVPLLSCKNIEQISMIPDNNLILRELAQLDENNSGQLFNLKTYRSSNNTLEELQIIFRRCPLIQTLAIHNYRREGQRNIMSITNLQNLQNQTLRDYSFYRDGVNEALQAIGKNLKHLHLICTEQVGLKALVDISQMCPNLKSLSLEHWFGQDQTKPSTKALEIPPFRNLKKLKIDMTSSYHCQERPLELLRHATHKFNKLNRAADFLLSNCLNVEYLEFDRTFVLTEDLMVNILDNNPLAFLKNLTIVQYDKTPRTMTELTPLVLDRIVMNCINRPEVIQTLVKRF